jgi:alkylation response protein AidB-like acyl-CoA dehydrogenase
MVVDMTGVTVQDMGDHYVVDGNKKWITNGIYADYFTVAVRTGDSPLLH